MWALCTAGPIMPRHVNIAARSGALALADAGIPTSDLVAAVTVGLMQQPDSMMQGATALGPRTATCKESWLCCCVATPWWRLPIRTDTLHCSCGPSFVMLQQKPGAEMQSCACRAGGAQRAADGPFRP